MICRKVMRSALEQAAWSAINKYQGSEIDVLLIDEITHFTETMYRFLRGRLRQVGVCFRASWSRATPAILAICG